MGKFSTTLAPRGAFCTGIAVGLSLVGILLGDGALITLGLSTVALMLSCYLLGRSNISKLEADISLPHKCHANHTYKPQVVIHNNRSFLDAFYVKLYVAFPHGTVLGSQSAWIPARSLATASLPISFPMRASALEHPYKFSSTFPLGLFRFSSRQLLQHPLTIYPRSITPEELLDHGVNGQCHDQDNHSHIEHSGEQRSIRPWQPGDAAKNIHWPTSIRSLARGDSLRIRELDPPGMLPDQATIIFHSFSSQREMMREDAFERAISLTAGTISYLRNLNIKTTLEADFLQWHPLLAKTRSQFYECLSVLADGQRAIGTELHELQTTINKISEEQQIIVISDMPPDVWHDLILIPKGTFIIDIRQIHFPFKKTISAKQALAQTA